LFSVGSETRYAKTEGGVHLAYQLLGAGPIDVLMLPVGFVPVDAMLEEPALARCLQAMASFSRVIRFDFRGVGLSDPVSPSDPPTLEQWMHDALAVLDAVDSDRAAVFATAENAKVAALLAATRPDRVRALVLVNAFAHGVGAQDDPFVLPAGDLDEVVDAFVDPEGSPGFDYLEVAVPSIADDPDFRDWWDRAGHRGASPATARTLLRATLGADVQDVLPTISVPTLVVHRVGNQAVPLEAGRYLAANIPNARSAELPGSDDLFWIGDVDGLLDEVQEFLTGERRAADTDRVLLSVLFTDVVGSTQQAASLGDARWRHVLEQHDLFARRELARYRGREVKTIGDGVLATFDGPARAVRCACALRDAVARLGLQIRAGIHTGEVELRAGDIAGIAVHIGQRVSSLADAGEVLVTRTLVDLVAGSGLTFEDRGTHTLKGIPDPWPVFAVTSH
jgi:class 3 adenylate cyclase